MVEPIEQLPDGCIGLRAVGDFTVDDFVSQVEPRVDEIADRHEKLRLILHLGADFSGFGDGAWGAKLRPITDSHLDRVGGRTYLARWNSIHHLVKVTVSPDGMKTYQAIAPGEGVFDRFSDRGTAPAAR